MAKCLKCQKRKAKRTCAAIGASLCNLCCGLLRGKEIHCPPDCSYLIKHRPYQEKRIRERDQESYANGFPPEDDILKDERMAWLVYHIEMPLKIYAEKRESFSDKDALLALEYAKEKIERDSSLVLISGESSKARDETGESVLESIQRCRYEREIILPGNIQTYKKEEKIQCLERALLSVRHFSRENPNGRSYLQQLLQRFKKIEELSRRQKIVTLR